MLLLSSLAVNRPSGQAELPNGTRQHIAIVRRAFRRLPLDCHLRHGHQGEGLRPATYNIKGGARDSQKYAQPTLDSLTDKIACSTGATFGSDYTIKKKGDFLFLVEYRQVGLGSVDPNLNDSDWNFSRLGFRGIKAAVSYGFYPWLIDTVTYFGANNLGSEKNLNIGVGDYNASSVFCFDLTTQF